MTTITANVKDARPTPASPSQDAGVRERCALLGIEWLDKVPASDPAAAELLDKWAQPDMAYALKLLSDHKEFQHPVVRSFAVRRLEAASDDELEMFLLQLVAV